METQLEIALENKVREFTDVFYQTVERILV